MTLSCEAGYEDRLVIREAQRIGTVWKDREARQQSKKRKDTSVKVASVENEARKRHTATIQDNGTDNATKQ